MARAVRTTRGSRPSQSDPKQAVPLRSCSSPFGTRWTPTNSVDAPGGGVSGPTRTFRQEVVPSIFSEAAWANFARAASLKVNDSQAASCRSADVLT